jgi:hypothetical protein
VAMCLVSDFLNSSHSLLTRSIHLPSFAVINLGLIGCIADLFQDSCLANDEDVEPSCLHIQSCALILSCLRINGRGFRGGIRRDIGHIALTQVGNTIEYNAVWLLGPRKLE